jgi:hypothetical protein
MPVTGSGDDENVIYAPRTIEEFQQRVAVIERMEQDGCSIHALVESLRNLHRGTRIGLPTLMPGERLYRARYVEDKPYWRADLSYPPAERVSKQGRLNLARESMFYCCRPSRADEDTFDIGCLYECFAQPEEFYVVGEWVVREPMMVNHMGFASPDFSGAFRAGQPWMEVEDPNPMIAHIRRWSSEVFTRNVPRGHEEMYRLSIALAKYSMLDFDEPINDFGYVSGVVYPSVATRFASDNLALLPSEVDRALELTKAWFVGIKTVSDIRTDVPAGDYQEPVGRIQLNLLDTSRRCHSDGEITWRENSDALFGPGYTRIWA